jgi:hypothetical protein
MSCARYLFVATLVGASFVADATLAAQATAAKTPPPMTPILAGKKFTPPIRGAAEVESGKPVIKREKDMVVTKIPVRNASDAPIARLTITETWYDKGGQPMGGGEGVLASMLQPGEVQVITIESPWKPGIASNNYQFSHANGTVKATRVDTLTVPGEPEAKQPAAKGKVAATKKP